MKKPSLNLRGLSTRIECIKDNLKVQKQIPELSSVLLDERLRHLAEIVNRLFDCPGAV